jgi:hypothetical protein
MFSFALQLIFKVTLIENNLQKDDFNAKYNFHKYS